MICHKQKKKKVSHTSNQIKWFLGFDQNNNKKKNSVELMLTMNAMNNMNTKDKSHFIMEL